MDSLGRPALLGTATATDSTPVARSSAEYAYVDPWLGQSGAQLLDGKCGCFVAGRDGGGRNLLQLFLGR